VRPPALAHYVRNRVLGYHVRCDRPKSIISEFERRIWRSVLADKPTNPHAILVAIKALHTVIWAFFVLAIAATWYFAWRSNFVAAACAIAIVLVEVAVLAFNHGECPLGRIVGRLTTQRRANFDIYLPPWLAAHTKSIFGPLYAGGVILTAVQWVRTLS
jgi:hypothetical protein